MIKRNSPLASKMFTDRQTAALDLLKSIATDIERLQEDFDDGGRTNWGHVEELGHVVAQLRETHNFLNNIDEE